MNAISLSDNSSKVCRYGSDVKVLELLKANNSYVYIANYINEVLSDSDKVLTAHDIEVWFESLPEDTQQEIAKQQYKKLARSVWNAERRGLKVRKQALERIESIIKSEMDEDAYKELSTRDKNELSKLIMKPMYIQESIDKLSGVGNRNGKRNYGDVNVNISVDVTDRMKELTKNKNDVIDIEYKDVKEKKNKKKDERKDGDKK